MSSITLGRQEIYNSNNHDFWLKFSGNQNPLALPLWLVAIKTRQIELDIQDLAPLP